jgi:hypothetical protein
MAAQFRIAQIQPDAHLPSWSLTRRVAFRFCFVYLGLFCICNTLGGLFPILRVDDTVGLGTLWPIREITLWTAAHIFGAKLPLVYRGSGSDDKTFDWVLTFCLLLFAVLATAIWSVLDRERENYVTVNKWFRLFIRIALASELLYFGMAKVIPTQMPPPSLTALLVPLGDISTYGLLWRSIGASPAYEIFAGCAEVLGGVLLIVPRTTMLGALVCLADMTEVWMLNMTYDVPVKLFSFHLLLLALFLLAPEWQRLADFAFRNRAVGSSAQPQLFNTRRANRIALSAQIVLGVWLLGMNAYSGWTNWHTDDGGGHPKSPLYGIWNVDELSIDGQIHLPVLTDESRWRRAVFDFPNRMAFQRMDNSFARYGASINPNDKTIALTNDSDKSWQANFTFQRPAQDQLILDGNMDSHRIHMRLRLVDRNKLVLVNRRFHWIQEY